MSTEYFIWQYTFFSAAHGTFSKIDHILGQKASLNKYKKIEITPCILSDHNAIKLGLNNKAAAENKQDIAQWSVDHRRNKGWNKKVSGI
jgi:hypothetical protein